MNKDITREQLRKHVAACKAVIRDGEPYTYWTPSAVARKAGLTTAEARNALWHMGSGGIVRCSGHGRMIKFYREA